MNIKRKIIVFVTAGLCILTQPLFALADKCDDVANKASETFAEAKSAGEQQDYARAAELFEEAGRYYKHASKMKNCRCPRIEGAAINNVELCRKNAAYYRQALEQSGLIGTYNQAATLFNQGNIYARNQQWDSAVSSFEEAEMLWRGIDMTSEIGRKSHKEADEASRLAELARQRM